MEKKLITVFTPTYNRKHLLSNCYESLKRQTCRDFLWLIVDDGSDDNTEALVQQWMTEDNGFAIRYIYKTNGGLHTAYNTAIEAMDTELALCVDSDDYLLDDAIERVLTCWKTRGNKGVAGIVALNQNPENHILGRRLPELEQAYIIELYCRYGCHSDLKMIYRTDLLKREGPIPGFGNEKHMNPYYLFLKIDQSYPMLLFDEPVCVVNYQDDGMSTNILSQYVQSPRSFAALRQMMISMKRASISYVFKNSIHLVSSALMARDLNLLFASPHKIMMIVALFPGVLLNVMVRIIYKVKYQK